MCREGELNEIFQSGGKEGRKNNNARRFSKND